MLSAQNINKLRRVMDDRLLLSDDAGFEACRKVWNATIDRFPAAIVRCKDTAEITQSVAIARQTGIPVCVRGGGHNIAGTAIEDGAMMLDLSAMCDISVDPVARIARVQGGATWAEFDRAAQRHGLVAPGGVVSSTGVAGLTLGGGFGWLARLHGLSADNVVALQVVLADGEVVTASEENHEDLFWALRGGSGNFGVVTELVFRLHSIGSHVWFGPTMFALEDARTVLSAYAANSHTLPREACVWANLMTAPAAPFLPPEHHSKKILTLMQFHAVADRQADFDRLYGGATPVGGDLKLRPYSEAQSALDAAYSAGARNYWRSHNHKLISDDLIDTLIDLARELPTPESELLICQLGGAIADRSIDLSAFPHRDIPFITTPGVRWRDVTDDEANIEWLRAASTKIAEHAVEGAYVNFIAERQGRSVDAYGSNLERLSGIKHQYDPQNLFRVNQNIMPVR